MKGTTVDRAAGQRRALVSWHRMGFILLAVVLSAVLAASSARAQSTLEAVQERGIIRCGTENSPVSAEQSPDGRWQGFDVEFCRAIAAAVLGDASRIEIVPLNLQLRIPALAAGAVDVLFANLTWTYSRDVREPIDYAAIILYDGQSFMGYEADGARRLEDVTDVVVCVQKGTTTEANLDAYIRTQAPTWKTLVVQSDEGSNEAFIRRRCTLQTNDRSFLVGWRAAFGLPGLILYPEVISKEPLSAATRTGDTQWLEIVRWVIHALVTAEELGIGSDNADALAGTSEDPAQRPLLGREPDFGAPLGLSDDWAFQAVRQVGNYGEIFERNLGSGSRLKLERGLNRLWNQGGLMYAPPLR